MNSNTHTVSSLQSAAKLAPPSDLSIMPHLAFSNDGGSLPEIVLDAPRTTVGRAPGNSIVLEDDAISGEHAEIVLRNGTFMLRDLGSSNGTRVNGNAIKEAEVVEGDQIIFGGVECVFHNGPTHEDVQSSPAVTSIPEVKAIPAVALMGDSELPSANASAPEAGSAATAISSSEAKEPGASFGSKLASFGKAALEETKRKAKLAGIKGKIEKLKLVDLNKAHYALGKKCYDLGLFHEHFQKRFDEIAKLKQSIEDNRKGTTAVDGEAASEALKKGATEVAMQAKAEGLNLKLQPLYIALGRDVEASNLVHSEVETELASVKTVREPIARAETQRTAVREDASHLAELKKHSFSLASDTNDALKHLGRKPRNLLRKPMRFVLIALATVICLILFDKGLHYIIGGKIRVDDERMTKGLNAIEGWRESYVSQAYPDSTQPSLFLSIAVGPKFRAEFFGSRGSFTRIHVKGFCDNRPAIGRSDYRDIANLNCASEIVQMCEPECDEWLSKEFMDCQAKPGAWHATKRGKVVILDVNGLTHQRIDPNHWEDWLEFDFNILPK